MVDPNSVTLRNVKDVRSCAILGKGKKIYIGNLPRDLHHQELGRLVKQTCETGFGEIDHVRVAHAEDDRRRRHKSRDKTKLNEGFCFVRFKAESSAEKAMKELCASPGGLAFEGLGPLKVEWARDVHKEDVDQTMLQQKEAKRKQRSEHKIRQRKRNKEREVEEIKTILQQVPEPAGQGAMDLFKNLEECDFLAEGVSRSEESLRGIGTHAALDRKTFDIDWSQVPVDCDPGAGEWYGSVHEDHVKRRRERKRDQVRSFALVLAHLVGAMARSKSGAEAPNPQARVVDFGSGSGALALPLAFLFPQLHFHALDMKPRAIKLLLEKAEKGGLKNLTASHGMIEHYEDEFDIGLALHACGNATDYSMIQCVKNRAAFALCPCCVGKLKFSLAGGSSFSAKYKNYRELPDGAGGKESGGLKHPRSDWMRQSISQDQFALIAKAGDISHGCDQDNHGQIHGYDNLARTCKANIEFDRSMYASENQYDTGLFRLINSGTTAKAEIILGVPYASKVEEGA
ncbi:RRM domain-containing protein [Chloropicon primus]|uniref:RRM domain-containing protein n=2 Tax=Chloropicon primus TaxID=1764295 RepID=A0A5B8MNI1_9CHLO|nr:hypothetical protein A3770_06p44750 [Chloropicon primus]UPR01177.1 RRM domain-containing protein [Chloropicon primus]|eukprot:QDZ21957.1 hypothetical protein A3770_06p44750 [Chloropicon primus]